MYVHSGKILVRKTSAPGDPTVMMSDYLDVKKGLHISYSIVAPEADYTVNGNPVFLPRADVRGTNIPPSLWPDDRDVGFSVQATNNTTERYIEIMLNASNRITSQYVFFSYTFREELPAAPDSWDAYFMVKT